MTLRAFHSRRLAVWAVVTLAGALLMAAGCSDDVTEPTFPEQPQPPMGTWFLGVWGTGPDDVYIVGQPGLIYHYDGDAWSKQESGTTVPLTDVWGDGAGNVYVTGHHGTILRSSGDGWSRMESGTSNHLFDVGRYQGDVLAVGRDGAIRVLTGCRGASGPTGVDLRGARQAGPETGSSSGGEEES